MTEKQFEIFPQNVTKDGSLIIIQKGLKLYNVKEVKELLNNLHEENEQLKKDLKRCREWLNSDKYDYETTLAFIKSKGYSLKDVLEYKGDDE